MMMRVTHMQEVRGHILVSKRAHFAMYDDVHDDVHDAHAGTRRAARQRGIRGI
jgi:hypothetical protein